jgi:hypothetical protein
MANKQKDPATFVLSSEVQKRLVQYANAILMEHKRTLELRIKMEVIDKAYARYIETGSAEDGEVQCNVLGDDNIIAPIVVSQVDSMVAYLADVFLSGAPLFPVVSTPAKRKHAEQLETLIDDHALLGGYGRQLLLFLRDAVKYNFSAIEADWTAIDQFNIADDISSSTGRKLDRKSKKFTKLRRLDPYNTIYDRTVAPGDVSLEGDYAGDIQILSRTKLKRVLNKLSEAKEAYNVVEAMKDGGYTNGGASANYHIHPTVSSYVTPRTPDSGVNWHRYLTGKEEKMIVGPDNYELVTLYVRIIPSEFGMAGIPQPNTPQIWKLRIVNSSILISAKRIVSAYDALPILFGQPLEDGLGYQTKSIAEGEIPIQEAATTLFNIRFAAARRAVSDRALYDPDMIAPADINAPVPAPKIPVRGSAMKSDRGLTVAYQQIPFDTRGLETVIQDAAQLVDFSKQLSGINGPMQGQFQKGNKSVQEWSDTMGGSDNRLRLPALTLSIQVFMPLKELIKLNIFQYGEDAVVVSQRNGEEHSIKIDELRKQVLTFRMADGYTPKSKLASFEMLNMGMNLIMNSPMLQEAYGTSLPALFAHIMSLGGVKGLEEYAPEVASAPMTTPTNLGINALQAPATVPVTQTPSQTSIDAPIV